MTHFENYRFVAEVTFKIMNVLFNVGSPYPSSLHPNLKKNVASPPSSETSLK